MKRSVIITKCIGIVKVNGKSFAVFDKPLTSLCSKFICVCNKTSMCLGTLLNNGIIELSANNIVEHNRYYKIFVDIEISIKEGWQKVGQPINDYKEETVLLWQELGSLEDPPIEAIDLYISELNKRT